MAPDAPRRVEAPPRGTWEWPKHHFFSLLLIPSNSLERDEDRSAEISWSNLPQRDIYPLAEQELDEATEGAVARDLVHSLCHFQLSVYMETFSGCSV